MQFSVLACDYDGTLAAEGFLEEKTVEALRRCLASGRKLVMVTGRELPELLGVCTHPELFEWIVAENGECFIGPLLAKKKRWGRPLLRNSWPF